MSINFDLQDLQAFAAAAELGNFRKAAEAVHISQPAFSRRIDKLEAALGVRLIDRNTRSMSLTGVGRDFARKVRLLLDDLDETLLGIREVGGARMGEVTIACVPSAVYYFLPQVLRSYHARFPRIRIKVHDASANEVLQVVASGEADFGVNFMGNDEPGIEFRSILEERFVAACRRDHPLARKRRVSWRELGEYDFMSVSKSSGNRMLMDLALASTGQRPQSVYEAQHVTTLLGLVEAGMGVAAVPALAMPAAQHPVLASVPLVDPVVTRRIGLIRRKGRSFTPAAEKLYELLLQQRAGRRARRVEDGTD
ncbi:MAG: LysR family transcriptional regulator [Curvibacter sp.]